MYGVDIFRDSKYRDWKVVASCAALRHLAYNTIGLQSYQNSLDTSQQRIITICNEILFTTRYILFPLTQGESKKRKKSFHFSKRARNKNDFDASAYFFIARDHCTSRFRVPWKFCRRCFCMYLITFDKLSIKQFHCHSSLPVCIDHQLPESFHFQQAIRFQIYKLSHILPTQQRPILVQSLGLVKCYSTKQQT